ncbi:hypothetical protein [Paenibacillus agri]|uniref:Uncharacterized protein n=1 Tax=Paenibacillus agri TaxID=2744309 RepID=A0A850ESE8_9BACL|nr:hypothetical protein [Paenibacillus agri]NUU63466.1 hypothetical protein [Paenibacillus agri]
MGNEFNKTEADFAYERYRSSRDTSPEEEIPTDVIRPVGTITTRGNSGEPTPKDRVPLESALAIHRRVGAIPVDFDGVIDEGSDPVLVGDEYLAADIGLNVQEPELRQRESRERPILASPAPKRDDLLESDAVLAADAAGLTGTTIDYADENETSAEIDYDEEEPLEDIPDADDLEAGTPVDPVSPPIDAMPGIDVLNGSQGEED